MKNFKIEEGIEIDVKRFYLDGVVLNSKCPQCGQLVEKDFGCEYLSYPIVGQKKKIYFYHECLDKNGDSLGDNEWVGGYLKLNISVDFTEKED